MTPRYSETERKHMRADVRQRLLKAAIQAIALHGYDGANINSISLQAGFAKGTIYNYFPAKKDLMIAILDESGSDHFDYIAKSIRKVDHPIRRLELFFAAGFAFVEEDPARGQVLVTTLYGTHPAFKEHLYKVYQPMFQLVAEEIILPGVLQGQFRQVDPESTSVMIMTFYLGTASGLDPQGKPWLDPEQVAAFVINALRINH